MALKVGDKVLRKRGKPKLKVGIIEAIGQKKARVRWPQARFTGDGYIHSTISLSSLVPFSQKELDKRRCKALQGRAMVYVNQFKNTTHWCANGCHRWLTPGSLTPDGKCKMCGEIPQLFILSEWNTCLCKSIFHSNEVCPNCGLTINLAEAAKE